jgi:hypothetical protein
MSDNEQLPEGWSREYAVQYATAAAGSGTYSNGEEVATVDVAEVEEEATA